MLQCFFPLRKYRLIKWSFFVHITTPYIHLRLDSRIEPKFSICVCLRMYAFASHTCDVYLSMKIAFK